MCPVGLKSKNYIFGLFSLMLRYAEVNNCDVKLGIKMINSIIYKCLSYTSK